MYRCQGWEAYGYACYWMEETPRSWSEAKEFCEGQDSFLVHLGDMWAVIQLTFVDVFLMQELKLIVMLLWKNYFPHLKKI